MRAGFECELCRQLLSRPWFNVRVVVFGHFVAQDRGIAVHRSDNWKPKTPTENVTDFEFTEHVTSPYQNARISRAICNLFYGCSALLHPGM